jgi:hypothetical protein
MQETSVPFRITATDHSQQNAGSKAKKVWEDRLNADKAGAMESAESFTKQFVNIVRLLLHTM